MITLTHRAQQQLIILSALDRGELRMAEAADLLAPSTRQIRRLRRAYRRHGPHGAGLWQSGLPIRAWQTARRLAAAVYKVSQNDTFHRDFELRDQIRRAAGSVMANIAEGLFH